MMPEGLLVEILNLVPGDYALTVKTCITGEVLIEKDYCHTDILNHLDHMHYWANYSKDSINKEFFINILGNDHRRNASAYKKWLEIKRNSFKDQRDISLYLTKYILFSNVTKTPRTREIIKFINYSNINSINSEYSYQFASILKTCFDRGEICWAFPNNLMVWVDDDGNAYDKNGLIHDDKHLLLFVPERYLKPRDLASFKHVDCIDKSFMDELSYVNTPNVVYQYCLDIINKAGFTTYIPDKEKEN